MKLTIDQQEVFQLLSKALNMELNDQTVSVDIDQDRLTFSLEVSGIGISTIVTPPPEEKQTALIAETVTDLLASALQGSTEMIEESETPPSGEVGESLATDEIVDETVLADLTAEERFTLQRNAENKAAIAALDSSNSGPPMSLEQLMAPPSADPPPAKRPVRKPFKYQPPPVAKAGMQHPYFHDLVTEELDEHDDHPGPTRSNEVRASEHKMSPEDRAATLRIIENANKG